MLVSQGKIHQQEIKILKTNKMLREYIFLGNDIYPFIEEDYSNRTVNFGFVL
jgi:hypothetical protein